MRASLLLLSSSFAVKRRLKLSVGSHRMSPRNSCVVLAAQVRCDVVALDEAVVSGGSRPSTSTSAFSVNGRSTAAVALRRLYSPSSSPERMPNSSPGARVVMLIAPPLVLRPNNVPCGPRRTSTRSTSVEVRLEEAVRRLPNAVDVDADTGHAADEELTAAAAAAARDCATRFGTMMPRVAAPVWMPPSSRSSAVNAWIETGVVCRIGFAALRGDDDLFELRGSGEGQCADDCRGQRAPESDAYELCIEKTP